MEGGFSVTPESDRVSLWRLREDRIKGYYWARILDSGDSCGWKEGGAIDSSQVFWLGQVGELSASGTQEDRYRLSVVLSDARERSQPVDTLLGFSRTCLRSGCPSVAKNSTQRECMCSNVRWKKDGKLYIYYDLNYLKIYPNVISYLKYTQIISYLKLSLTYCGVFYFLLYIFNIF